MKTLVDRISTFLKKFFRKRLKISPNPNIGNIKSKDFSGITIRSIIRIFESKINPITTAGFKYGDDDRSNSALDSNYLSNTLLKIANREKEKENFLKAELYYERYISHETDRGSPPSIKLGVAYYYLGFCLSKRGLISEAIPALLKASKIFIPYSPSSLRYSENLELLANCYLETNDYKLAIKLIEKAKEHKKNCLGSESIYLVESYIQIGRCEMAAGNNRRMESTFGVAEEMLTKVSLECSMSDQKRIATCRDAIGIYYMVKKDDQKALTFLKGAKELKLKLFDPIHSELSVTDNYLGEVYMKLGKIEKGIDFLKEGIERLGEKAESHILIPQLLENLGKGYYLLGKPVKAIRYYSESMEKVKSIYGKKYRIYANCKHKIGDCYCLINKFEEAEQSYLEAVKIMLSCNGFNHFSFVLLHNKLGELFLNQGKFKQAKRYLEIARNIVSDKEFKGGRSLKMKTFVNLGKYYSMEEDWINANISFCEARNELKKMVWNYKKSKEYKSKLIRENKHLFLESLAVISKLMTIDGNKYEKEIFQLKEEKKASRLIYAYRILGLMDELSIPEIIQKKFYKLKASICDLESTLNSLDGEEFVRKDERLRKEKEKFDQLWESLKKKYPKLLEVEEFKKISTLEEVQSELKPHQIIVNQMLGKRFVYTQMICKTRTFFFSCELKESDHDIIDNYKLIIKLNELSKFEKAGRRLYELLLEPAETFINQVKCASVPTLIFIPDGKLFGIPFNTLITQKSTTKIEKYSELSYLIKSALPVMQYSATFWLAAKRRQKKTSNSKRNCLGIVPCIFDKNPSKLEPLLKSFQLLKIFSRIFHNYIGKFTSLTHGDATRDNVLKALAYYKYVVLFTHSIKDKEGNIKICLSDQNIDVNDISSLKMNADLVVICSCGSGIGNLIHGEGFDSANRAFIKAGVPNVLFTLFECDEEYAKRMIAYALTMLNEDNYSEVWRAIILKFINEGLSPYNWSQFQIIGTD